MPDDWLGRGHAEQARQWPIIAHVSERIAAMPEFDGLLLVGSFASATLAPRASIRGQRNGRGTPSSQTDSGGDS